MTVETASTHTKLRRNKSFNWVRSLPRETRELYVRLARVIARRVRREQKVRREELLVARTVKAQKEHDEAEIFQENKTVRVGKAEGEHWKSEDEMMSGLKKQ